MFFVLVFFMAKKAAKAGKATAAKAAGAGASAEVIAKRIAIVGASKDKEKFGNRAVRAYLSRGWTVYPVNLYEKEIEGVKVYKTVTEIKDEVELASIYLPPARLESSQ